MSNVISRVPMLVTAGSLLMGAMLSGAAVTYAYSENVIENTSATRLLACTYTCDKDDPDDCGSSCKCNDSIGCVS